MMIMGQGRLNVDDVPDSKGTLAIDSMTLTFDSMTNAYIYLCDSMSVHY